MRTVATAMAISLLCISIESVPLRSQTGQEKPTFEVASIKANPGPLNGSGIHAEPGGTRMTMTAVTLKGLVSFAYRVRDFQILNGPEWINTDRYDIQAKAEDGSIARPTPQTDPTLPDGWALRTQSLLENRFQLKMHRETRELPVYELVEAKGGLKIMLAADQNPQAPKPGDPPPPPPQRGAPPGPGGMRTQRTPQGWTLQARSVPISIFISSISDLVARPIVNKTDLRPGLYDIDLKWTDNGPGSGTTDSVSADALGPSIFTALQEQLGLRLVSAKDPVEVVVIDSVQKPTVN